MGKTGRGTHEHHNVIDRIDVITGTLGKALGGASGGYTSGKKEMIELLRQRSRPYLFSNSVAPPIVAASIAAIDLLTQSTELRDKLMDNTRYFREKMTEAGFDIRPGQHPIVPVMFGEAQPAVKMAEALLEKGVYVIPFSFPVVPKGKARIRTQVSAAHSKEDLDFAIENFSEAKSALDI
jgi:glycine C-acetyltransferase